jgi:hypothetical protein
MKEKYYVFVNSLDGEVFYIGSNWRTKSQNWWMDKKPGHHSGAWANYVKKRYNQVECKIIDFFEYADECYEAKNRLIKQYQAEGKNIMIDEKG